MSKARLPRTHGINKAAERAARQRKITAGSLVMPFRELVSLSDAQGRTIYDRDMNVTSFTTNLKPIGLPLLDKRTLGSLLTRLGEEETASRLETVSSTMPENRSPRLKGISMHGAETGSQGNRYVAFDLSAKSTRDLRQDSLALYSEFEIPFSGAFSYISFYCTFDPVRATLIRDETRSSVALPVAAILDRVTLRPTQGL